MKILTCQQFQYNSYINQIKNYIKQYLKIYLENVFLENVYYYKLHE